jgi:CYTH domain-containing protein
MGVEIERKFLVVGDAWRDAADAGVRIAQGYLCADPTRTIRVRTMGPRAYLTIKGAPAGLTRAEFEYEIPADDVRELLGTLALPTPIDKTRYTIMHAGLEWVVDEFHGDNAPLVMAEVELDSEDQTVELPQWAGLEVSGDARYSNSNLSAQPFGSWGET